MQESASLSAAVRVPVLVLSALGLSLALPLECVVELCRPLPIRAVPRAPDFVLGLARWRGREVPVLDLEALLKDGARVRAGRFVGLRLERPSGGAGSAERAGAAAGAEASRGALLAVEGASLETLEARAWEALPPLLAKGLPAVRDLAVLDKGFRPVLEASRLLSPEAWDRALELGA